MRGRGIPRDDVKRLDDGRRHLAAGKAGRLRCIPSWRPPAHCDDTVSVVLLRQFALQGPASLPDDLTVRSINHNQADPQPEPDDETRESLNHHRCNISPNRRLNIKTQVRCVPLHGGC
ncbi:uncharacterized protein [Physcomitrium patens]|uniref:uncharacterized protein n=1 Tax=Physcomitrium patens TaxID=3218 RepID=UPI003CCD0565